MGDRSRVAGVAGLAWVVAAILQFLVAPAPPSFDAPGAEIRAYLVENRSGVLTQGFLQVVGALVVVVFLVGLRDVLRGADDGPMLATVAMIAGGVLLATVLIAQAGFDAPVWIDGNAQTMSDDGLRLAWSLSYLAFGAAAPVIVLLTGSTAVAGLRSKVIPAWTAWLSALCAVAGLAGFAMQFGSDLGGLGLGAFFAVIVFVLANSVAMVTGKATAAAA